MPGEDQVFIDEDEDSDQDFEIGIDNAGSGKKKKFLEEDSFEPNNDSHDGFEMAEDFNMDSFLNGNKRVISTAAAPAQKTIEQKMGGSLYPPSAAQPRDVLKQ